MTASIPLIRGIFYEGEDILNVHFQDNDNCISNSNKDNIDNNMISNSNTNMKGRSKRVCLNTRHPESTCADVRHPECTYLKCTTPRTGLSQYLTLKTTISNGVQILKFNST